MARPRQVSDDEILAAARDAFMEDPNASTVTIAERVGLSQAAIFKRFGTKVRLMLASMGVHDAPPWAELLQGGPDERPIEEQLVEIGAELDQFFRMLIPRIHAVKAVGLDIRRIFGDGVPPPVKGFEAMASWFQAGMDQGRIRQGDAAALAISFIGGFQGRAFWSHFVGEGWLPTLPSPDAYVTLVVETFWRGIAPEEPTP